MLALQTRVINRPAPLVMTIVEMISRKPDHEMTIEMGGVIHDFKTVRILSREPLPQQAIHNVLKRNPDFKLNSLSAKDYNGFYEF